METDGDDWRFFNTLFLSDETLELCYPEITLHTFYKSKLNSLSNFKTELILEFVFLKFLQDTPRIGRN